MIPLIVLLQLHYLPTSTFLFSTFFPIGMTFLVMVPFIIVSVLIIIVLLRFDAYLFTMEL